MTDITYMTLWSIFDFQACANAYCYHLLVIIPLKAMAMGHGAMKHLCVCILCILVPRLKRLRAGMLEVGILNITSSILVITCSMMAWQHDDDDDSQRFHDMTDWTGLLMMKKTNHSANLKSKHPHVNEEFSDNHWHGHRQVDTSAVRVRWSYHQHDV